MFMTIFWAVVAGTAIIAELLTGTLYLLVLGGAAAAACALAFGTDVSAAAQFALFSALCIPTMLVLRKRRLDNPLPSVMAADVGSRVEVVSVREDGTYRVRYSGTDWDAVLVEGAATADAPKWLVIVGTDGNLLKCKPAPAVQ